MNVVIREVIRSITGKYTYLKTTSYVLTSREQRAHSLLNWVHEVSAACHVAEEEDGIPSVVECLKLRLASTVPTPSKYLMV